MYQNYEKGGMRVPNVDVMTKSLRLAWISRLLAKDEKKQSRTIFLKCTAVLIFC